ncbi:MAG: hypothetical protein ACJAT7_000578 [Psychromonas sp.]|jgi:hypothetical protein|uniref:hypothetical protein n=1 Tax=Psychromonas sp. TaxID=1884585 RepID=UPI0039E6AA08
MYRFLGKIVLISVTIVLLIGCKGEDSGDRTHPQYTDFTDELPTTENPNENTLVPNAALAEDVRSPTTVIGNGTPQSCTSEAVVTAIAKGGVITFECGPDPVSIPMDETAKIVNDTGPKIVIDGGGKVALSGQGERRILYMNTCDEAQKWTTSHCQNQDHPQLTIQNLTFTDGDSRNETEFDGGGAIWVRGGRFKVVNSHFFSNTCADTGPDVGGGAIRVFSQYDGLPVYVANSTFGGPGELANVCSNGGAISSIGVSWSIYNSSFQYNRAIGNGGNPSEIGTPGGGSGGAIYNDGNTMTLSIFGTSIENNEVNSYGSAIFFVTNDHSGDIHIEDSTIKNNSGGSWENVIPSVAMHEDTAHTVINSNIQ